MATPYQVVSADVERLDESQLARPSGCLGWTRADLLFHLLLDAQRAPVTFASAADEPADVDFVTYWAPFRPGGGRVESPDGGVARPSGLARPTLSPAWRACSG